MSYFIGPQHLNPIKALLGQAILDYKRRHLGGKKRDSFSVINNVFEL
jgi:hypothetical protein